MGNSKRLQLQRQLCRRQPQPQQHQQLQQQQVVTATKWIDLRLDPPAGCKEVTIVVVFGSLAATVSKDSSSKNETSQIDDKWQSRTQPQQEQQEPSSSASTTTTAKVDKKGLGGRPKVQQQQRQGRMRRLLRSWLPILQLLLILQAPTLEIKCDESGLTSLFDVMPELEDQQLSAQLSQQKSFDYSVQSQEQEQQQQQQQLPELIQMLRELAQPGEEPGLSQSTLEEPAKEQAAETASESNQQAQQLINELLESQPSTANVASSSAGSSNGGQQDGENKAGSSNTGAASSSGGSASGSTSTSLSEQLSGVASMLQQIGTGVGQSSLNTLVQAAEQNNALSNAIINSVLNSLTRPQTAQSGGGQRKQAAASNQNQVMSVDQVELSAGRRPNVPVVGQRPSIDGNIQYDPQNGVINGFIGFPNFTNLFNNNASKNYFKPLVWAALKTVPIKLGSAGWKLLQLIAWKKIYKTHHPKSGEIIIEQEMVGKHSGQEKKFSGNSINYDMGRKYKTSKMGQSYSSYGGDEMMMHSPMSMSHMMGGGGNSGSGVWPYSDGAMSASMIYQRHLLPPLGHHYHPHHDNGVGNVNSPMHPHHQHQSAAHPATAAAAAAAATAAAIQSQWVQHQFASEAIDASEQVGVAARSNQTGNNGGPADGGRSGGGGRKRSAAFGGNWAFAATPAHAYAAAAAAANAAVAAAAASQHHQGPTFNPLNRLGLHAANPFEGPATTSHDGFQHALAGMMYQNLFDNAAAMAVQNAVKLPHTAHIDHLDQSDSLTGSSLSLGDSSLGADVIDGWPSEQSSNSRSSAGLLGPHHQRLVNGMSDSLLALNEMSEVSGSNNNGGASGIADDNNLPGPQSLASVPDFDDTPAGKFLGAALNETYAAISGSG